MLTCCWDCCSATIRYMQNRKSFLIHHLMSTIFIQLSLRLNLLLQDTLFWSRWIPFRQRGQVSLQQKCCSLRKTSSTDCHNMMYYHDWKGKFDLFTCWTHWKPYKSHCFIQNKILTHLLVDKEPIFSHLYTIHTKKKNKIRPLQTSSMQKWKLTFVVTIFFLFSFFLSRFIRSTSNCAHSASQAERRALPNYWMSDITWHSITITKTKICYSCSFFGKFWKFCSCCLHTVRHEWFLQATVPEPHKSMQVSWNTLTIQRSALIKH